LKLVAIGLGSNLGDRLGNLRAAREKLRELADGGLLVAPVYRTAPVGCPPGSPDFFNSVVAFRFGGTVRELLDAVRGIERELGRAGARTRGRNAPRPIDLDILVFGGETVSDEDLTVPHPRMGSRRFVLQPLADILPGLVAPGSGGSAAECLERLGRGGGEVAEEAAEW